MRTRLLVSLVAWTLGGAASAQDTTLPATFAFVHTNVVDVTAGAVALDVTVFVRGNRIAAVGDVDLPPGTVVVDGEGTYVIPGLWDMHAHLEWNGWDASELMVAHGVTGARDLWGSLDDVKRRRDPETQDTLAPRVVMAGAVIDGAPSLLPGTVSVTTPEAGRAAVDSLADGGAAFVKVYDALSPEVYDAVVARARERGVPVAGHVPWRVRASHVSNAGQRSIEHAFGVLPACSAGEDSVLGNYAAVLDHIATQDMPAALQAWLGSLGVMGTPDDEACRALAERLVANETWLVPTLVVLRGSWFRDDTAFRDDPRLAYVPAGMRTEWLPENGFPSKFLAPADWDVGQAMYRRAVEAVGLLHEAGVSILAGSDAGAAYSFFGSGLHDELALLVEAGLSPAEALRTATVNPAVFLGRTEDLGTVEAGKLADLVVLDGNPLEDVANVRAIRGVVLDGVWLPRARLDAVLARTAARLEGPGE